MKGLKPKKPPFGLNIQKGSKNVVLTRQLAESILSDPVAIALLNFLQTTIVPDEHFYSTLATVKSFNAMVG